MATLPLNPTHHINKSNTLLDLLILSDLYKIVHFEQLQVPGISHQDLCLCARGYDSTVVENFIFYVLKKPGDTWNADIFHFKLIIPDGV